VFPDPKLFGLKLFISTFTQHSAWRQPGGSDLPWQRYLRHAHPQRRPVAQRRVS